MKGFNILSECLQIDLAKNENTSLNNIRNLKSAFTSDVKK